MEGMELPGTNPMPYAVFVDEKDIHGWLILAQMYLYDLIHQKKHSLKLKYHVQVQMSDKSWGFMVKYWEQNLEQIKLL